MLSWIIAIVFMLIGAFKSEIVFWVVAGLFAIAGSIDLHK